MIYRWSNFVYIYLLFNIVFVISVSPPYHSKLVNLFLCSVIIFVIIAFLTLPFSYWIVEDDGLVFKELTDKRNIYWSSIKRISIYSIGKIEFKIVMIEWGAESNLSCITPLTKDYKKLIQNVINKSNLNNTIIDNRVLQLIK